MITTSPTYPAAGDTVTLASDVGDAAATRFELTSVPASSAITPGLLVDPGGKPVQSFAPDVAGEYGILAHCYEQNVEPYSASLYQRYLGTDPDTTSIHVGEYLDLPIAPVNGHGSTLRLLIVNSNVRAASLANPLTELARVAALDTTVAAAVAALVGVVVTALDTPLATNVRALMTAYAGHLAKTSPVHLAADTTNTTIAAPPYSDAVAISTLNEIASRLTAHMRPTITPGTPWHTQDDTAHALAVSPGASNIAQATVLCADLRIRVYGPHIVQTLSPHAHSEEDTDNTLTVTAPLPVAIAAYLDYVVDNDPVAPAGESEGAGDAAAAFGFSRA